MFRHCYFQSSLAQIILISHNVSHYDAPRVRARISHKTGEVSNPLNPSYRVRATYLRGLATFPYCLGYLYDRLGHNISWTRRSYRRSFKGSVPPIYLVGIGKNMNDDHYAENVPDLVIQISTRFRHQRAVDNHWQREGEGTRAKEFPQYILTPSARVYYFASQCPYHRYLHYHRSSFCGSAIIKPRELVRGKIVVCLDIHRQQLGLKSTLNDI